MTSTPSIDPALIPFLDALAELLAQAVMENVEKKEMVGYQDNE